GNDGADPVLRALAVEPGLAAQAVDERAAAVEAVDARRPHTDGAGHRSHAAVPRGSTPSSSSLASTTLSTGIGSASTFTMHVSPSRANASAPPGTSRHPTPAPPPPAAAGGRAPAAPPVELEHRVLVAGLCLDRQFAPPVRLRQP